MTFMPFSRDARKNIDIQHHYRKLPSSRVPAISSAQCMRQAALDLLLTLDLTQGQLSRLVEL